MRVSWDENRTSHRREIDGVFYQKKKAKYIVSGFGSIGINKLTDFINKTIEKDGLKACSDARVSFAFVSGGMTCETRQIDTEREQVGAVELTVFYTRTENVPVSYTEVNTVRVDSKLGSDEFRIEETGFKNG